MGTTNQSRIVPNKMLVTGASGLLGVAAIEKFLAAGWEVVGVSRRKPELSSGRDIEFLSVDLRDEERARVAFEPLTDITHIAYTALHEKPELVAGWSSKEQIETNNAMLRNVVAPGWTMAALSASPSEDATTAEVAVAAGHKYPDHDFTSLAGLAQAGEPVLGPGQQLRRVRAGAEPGDEEKRRGVVRPQR
jgi:hypothetical protein